MNARLYGFGLSAVFFAVSTVEAQQQIPFEILPGSTYTFGVGFAAIPDCDGNDDLQCDFLIEGTFVLEETTAGAVITDADLELTSPLPFDPITPGDLTTAEGVEEFLEGLTFVAIPSIPSVVAYEADLSPGTGPGLFLTYSILPPDGGGVLEGGFDQRFVDGAAVQFDATLRRVPEPASALLMMLAAAAVATRRR